MESIKQYLRPTEIIDWDQPDVRDLATKLVQGMAGPFEVAKRCFEWVRDEIRHSHDHQLNPVTCTASEVLCQRTGYCYAKSHLLAALLRANGIPAGLCYQRLSRDDNGPPFCLHGLNAVYVRDIGWYRVDPRGNRPGVDAQFTPPVERLAFPVRLSGEANLPEIYADPLKVVVETLRAHSTWDSLWEHLPDIEVVGSGGPSGCLYHDPPEVE
jgi:transglutaminase-like putative cysteine protease